MSTGTEVSIAEELLRRADDTEALAKLVSYGPDKSRLQERANRLRQQAQALRPEDRSWRSTSRPQHDGRRWSGG